MLRICTTRVRDTMYAYCVYRAIGDTTLRVHDNVVYYYLFILRSITRVGISCT